MKVSVAPECFFAEYFLGLGGVLEKIEGTASGHCSENEKKIMTIIDLVEQQISQ